MAQQHPFSSHMSVARQPHPSSQGRPLFAANNDTGAALARPSQMPDARGSSHDGPGNTEEECASKIEELDEVIDAIVTDANSRVLSSAEKREYLRKRNALYSQRKYYRKKLKMHQLTTEKASLEKKNALINIENALLENAIAWANKQVELHENQVSTSTSGPANSYSLLMSEQSCTESSSSSVDQLLRSALRLQTNGLLQGPGPLQTSGILHETSSSGPTTGVSSSQSTRLLRSLLSAPEGPIGQLDSSLQSIGIPATTASFARASLPSTHPTADATLLNLLLRLRQQDPTTPLAQQQRALANLGESNISSGFPQLLRSMDNRQAPAAPPSTGTLLDLTSLVRRQQEHQDLSSLQAFLQQVEALNAPRRPGLLERMFGTHNDAQRPSSTTSDRMYGNLLHHHLVSPPMASLPAPSSSVQPLLSAINAAQRLPPALPPAAPSLPHAQNLSASLLERQRKPSSR